MIPSFRHGLLPEGIHETTWVELEARFGTTPHRRRLLAGMRRALVNLHQAGCIRVWINGSFVTEKQVPGDYDLCWDEEGVDEALLDAVILDVAPPRLAQKITFGGDILPNPSGPHIDYSFVDFFQVDKITGGQKGIVLLHLETLST